MNLPKKICIVSDGQPNGTYVLDERGDNVGFPIQAITWHHSASESPSVIVKLDAILIPTNIDAKARYVILDPGTKILKDISLIRFADGTEWIADAS